MSKNTLFNYFTKSPSQSPSVVKQTDPKVSTPAHTPTSTPRRKNFEKFASPSTATGKRKPKVKPLAENGENLHESNSSPEGNLLPRKRRKRIINAVVDSDDSCPELKDDSEDEYKPEKLEESSSEEVSSPAQSESESENGSDDSDVAAKSKESTVRRKKFQNSSITSNRKNSSKANLSVSLSTTLNSTAVDDVEGKWPHLTLDFLQPDKIRDGNRRRPSDPDYNPSTLYVPEDYKKKLTPAVRQWWEMKSQNYDCVIFFKVGKFYELYHMDAVIACNELNLTFMRGEFAHSGFPEIAYGRFSSTLVEKGYKVARVEQTETPDMMAERCKTMRTPTKFDKVVRREICQITSRGTRVFNVYDGDTKEAESHFLFAIAEKEIENSSSEYGVCFVDTSIGIFHIGQFTDDRHSSRLRTLFAQHIPAQILCEKNHVSGRTRQLLNTALASVQKDFLLPEYEFWSASKTVLALAEAEYFKRDDCPLQLEQFLGERFSATMMIGEHCEIGIKCLGAVIWYLKRCLLDHQLLSLAKFTIYLPIDVDAPEKRDSSLVRASNMVLDATSLKNLTILENSKGGLEGTLLQKLDHCCTRFGKRLLHLWLCNPLGNVEAIEDRQRATSFLKHCDINQELRKKLSQLPDLERLLCRIHSMGSRGIQTGHPDTRAIMFEEKAYSKKKILEFLAILNGFELACDIAELFRSISDVKPRLIAQCVCGADDTPSGLFPDLSVHLSFFKNAFDHAEAQKEGRIYPSPGADPDYDEAIRQLKAIEKELNDYLKSQCNHFGCKVTYFGTDKKRYQLEVPDSFAKRAGDKYELSSQRKGFKRFVTNETKDFLDRMIAAEEQKISVLKSLRERIFARFSQNFDDWNTAVQCIATIDVLLSLAEYSLREDSVTCIPKFSVSSHGNSKPFIRVKEGRYPCGGPEDVFIPNDTVIGSDSDAQLILLTGPNMGGKSTLMRQLGLIAVMAHIGCEVPAADVHLSPVDRIFTRIGAQDDIMAGESTFYIELCETATILRHASDKALVLVDELGRGTSTYDGMAIASAVLSDLARIGCRTIFSTHYHALVKRYEGLKLIRLSHMACMVENEGADDANGEVTGGDEVVTFLYKMADGACPKSYGFNAARLAGMPNHIIKIGRERAAQFSKEAREREIFKMLLAANFAQVTEILKNLSV